jgi:uncharacterized protein (DUF1800 family)
MASEPLISKYMRRVAFGCPPQQALPADPVAWAQTQVAAEPPIDIVEADGSRRADLPPDITLRWDMNDIMLAWQAHSDAEDASFARAKGVPAQQFQRLHQETMHPYWQLEPWKEVQARVTTARYGASPVFEKLWHFWANHFMVAPGNQRNEVLVGPNQRMLRQRMTGSFRDMLWHAVTHPGMLSYLDNNRNTGPNSVAVKRGWTQDSINENLGRELLELFTVSTQVGYQQADVEQATLVLTGWGIHRADKWRKPGRPLGTYFDYDRHEAGSQTIMGKRYSNFFSPGKKLEALVTDLAQHEWTAKHIATKLCVYFMDDDPPARAVEAVTQAFVKSSGHLPTVHKALLAQCWETIEETRKFGSPESWFVQTLTMLEMEPPRTIPLTRDSRGIKTPYLLGDLGQPLPRCPQPNGWPIRSVEWISKEALERRARILEQMVRRRGTMVDFNPQDAQRVSDLLRRVIQREMASDHPTRALIQDALKSQQVATAVVLTHVSPTMLWS